MVFAISPRRDNRNKIDFPSPPRPIYENTISQRGKCTSLDCIELVKELHLNEARLVDSLKYTKSSILKLEEERDQYKATLQQELRREDESYDNGYRDGFEEARSRYEKQIGDLQQKISREASFESLFRKSQDCLLVEKKIKEQKDIEIFEAKIALDDKQMQIEQLSSECNLLQQKLGSWENYCQDIVNKQEKLEQLEAENSTIKQQLKTILSSNRKSSEKSLKKIHLLEAENIRISQEIRVTQKQCEQFEEENSRFKQEMQTMSIDNSQSQLQSENSRISKELENLTALWTISKEENAALHRELHSLLNRNSRQNLTGDFPLLHELVTSYNILTNEFFENTLLDFLNTPSEIATVCYGTLRLCDSFVTTQKQGHTDAINNSFPPNIVNSLKHKAFVQEYFVDNYRLLLESANPVDKILEFIFEKENQRDQYFDQEKLDWSFLKKMEQESIKAFETSIVKLCTLFFQFKLSNPPITIVFDRESTDFNPALHQFVLQGTGQKFKYVVVPTILCGGKSVDVKVKVTN